MSEKLVGDTIKAFCGRCGGERNCEIKGLHTESGSEGGGHFVWHVKWYLLVCRGCEFPFAQSVATDSESIHYYYDEYGDENSEAIETIETWPAKSKRKLPEWFKHWRVEGTLNNSMSLNAALSELYRALDADLLVLSSIGIRTAFDAASEALGIEPGLPFEAKLQALMKEQKIRESEKDTLNVLINAGNAAAHRGWQPKTEQLDLQMDILEEFIFNSMVLPARNKLRAENVAKLKSDVPSKSKPKTKKVSPAVK